MEDKQHAEQKAVTQVVAGFIKREGVEPSPLCHRGSYLGFNWLTDWYFP